MSDSKCAHVHLNDKWRKCLLEVVDDQVIVSKRKDPDQSYLVFEITKNTATSLILDEGKYEMLDLINDNSNVRLGFDDAISAHIWEKTIKEKKSLITSRDKRIARANSQPNLKKNLKRNSITNIGDAFGSIGRKKKKRASIVDSSVMEPLDEIEITKKKRRKSKDGTFEKSNSKKLFGSIRRKKRSRMSVDFSDVHVSMPEPQKTVTDRLDTMLEEFDTPFEEALSSPRVIPKEPRKGDNSKRANIANEIFTTEKTYINNMSTALEVYNVRLQESSEEHGISAANVNAIFSNMEILLGFNQIFFTSLEGVLNDWNEESCIGEIFLEFAPYLRMYSEYSNQYSECVATYHQYMRGNEAFMLANNEIRMEIECPLALEDLLITPIQRIPRYSLLLMDLKKHTSEDHPDYENLCLSVTEILEVAEYINEGVRRTENNKKISEMRARGIKLGNLIQAHRYLIKEGLVKCKDKKKKDIYHIFLFNDILVRIKKDFLKNGDDYSQPKYCWPLTLCWRTSKILDKLCTVLGPDGESFTFVDGEGWSQIIGDAISEQIDLLNFNSDGDDESTLNVRFETYEFDFGAKFSGSWKLSKFDGLGTLEYFGNIYTGAWKDGIRHGKGKQVYRSGHIYTGYWQHDVPYGNGKLEYNDGSMYVGEWKHGMRDGEGRLLFSNNDVYEGTWKDDRMDGSGHLQLSSGLSYHGDLVKDEYDGTGYLELPTGTIYEGEFSEGKKHGSGTLLHKDGSTYKGEFLQNLRSGTGVWKHKNASFNGSWYNDKPHGKGKYKYQDGSVYVGEFKNGQRSGKGKCIYSSGAQYEGEWAEDFRDGHGSFLTDAGFHYTGDWEKGKMCGKGILIFANGASYNGSFSDNTFAKNGIYEGVEEEWIQRYEGEYKNGKMEGKGFILYLNGDTYSGGFRNNKRHGNGTYTFENGESYSGKWLEGVRVGKGSITNQNEKPLNGHIVSSKFNVIEFSIGFDTHLPALLPEFPAVVDIDTILLSTDITKT
eukprot:TRINITY_DN8114_c0_g1_i1.p1 TRINITY_DN8114_c0_g1~~TRINITY_DN8114_c0_g1_i1.p1  ORF type:complete len:996 (+),score=250.18 TRINITY_DN8114_c0_g1_i1:19-3006(+)